MDAKQAIEYLFKAVDGALEQHKIDFSDAANAIGEKITKNGELRAARAHLEFVKRLIDNGLIK